MKSKTLIADFDNYVIYSDGRVLNRIRGSFLRTFKRKDGYISIQLSNNGERKTYKLHRLVAENLIPRIKGKYCVNHINGNKSDNRVENLEWCTNSENQKHAFKIGLLTNRGSNHPRSKLTETNVLDIRQELKKGKSYKELAEKHGVHCDTIGNIKNRKTWKHI